LSHIGTDLTFLAACSDSLLRYANIIITLFNFKTVFFPGCFVAQKRKSQ
jgi:hypothetical protein